MSAAPPTRAAFAGSGATGVVRSPSRLRTVTQKVPTPFGALYSHVRTDDDGAVRDVAISTPGKHQETAVHEALIGLGLAITACLPGAAPDGEPPA